jgi:site-specific DNA-methyltransferase (cytosine-N4-specific)
MSEKEVWARRFFWVALAETVRLTSNSRTSTFKLHIRKPENIEERKNMNIVEIFKNILDNNLVEYKNLEEKLNKNELLKNGTYNRNINISSSDVRTITESKKADVIITSPPYGDNDTTVPYGQHSYLPLQWIDFSDIGENINKDDMLVSTHEIDYRSLGGHRCVTGEEKDQLLQQSYSLRNFAESLCAEPRDRTSRVVSFFRDLNKCIDPILNGLEDGGIMVWVLGNRKVGGKRVPLDKILTDLFEKRNVSVFCELSRKIPSKRMAPKNNIAETMSDEIILLMRKTD